MFLQRIVTCFCSSRVSLSSVRRFSFGDQAATHDISSKSYQELKEIACLALCLQPLAKTDPFSNPSACLEENKKKVDSAGRSQTPGWRCCGQAGSGTVTSQGDHFLNVAHLLKNVRGKGRHGFTLLKFGELVDRLEMRDDC